MAFTGNYVCNSFKSELMQAMHNFTTGTGHVFKIALYTSSAALDASTTVYSATNEVSGTAYTAGGLALTNVTPTLGGTSTAYTDFADALWSTSTISLAAGALIYNTNGSLNKAVVVLDFGGNKSSSAGDFTVIFPPPASGTAIIRIA